MYYKEKGNKVRFFIDCGMDATGKKKILSKQFKLPDGISKKEKNKLIAEKGAEFERRVKGGSNSSNDKTKFKTFVKGEYEKSHLETLKPKTAEGYRTVINYRLIEYFGEMQLQDITPLDVRKWLASIERKDGTEKKLSDNSKGNWFRTLSAILGKAEEWGYIESNPCKKVKQPRKPQSEVKALSQEDVYKVYEGFDKFEDPRIVILMKILILTGIRSSECCGLEWRDIDFDSCSIRIERETIYLYKQGFSETAPKSASSRRVVAVPEALIEDLKAYQAYQAEEIEKRGDLWTGAKGERAKLFTQFDGKPVSNYTIRFWVKKYLKWCEVPYVTPHGLRHTFASLMIANGIDARTTAAQMGHSQASLVFNTYANPQESAKRKAANLMGDLVSKHPGSEK